MKFRSKAISGCVGAFILLAGPAAHASSWSGSAATAASGAATGAASRAGNAAAQSAVQSARDDIARRAMAQQLWNSELRRAQRHHRGR